MGMVQQAPMQTMAAPQYIQQAQTFAPTSMMRGASFGRTNMIRGASFGTNMIRGDSFEVAYLYLMLHRAQILITLVLIAFHASFTYMSVHLYLCSYTCSH